MKRKPMNNHRTVQVSFRLPSQLVERMKDVSSTKSWPPPPSQTEIVTKGVEMVLRQLERQRERAQAAE